jgi:hypothetical protein
MDACFLLVTLNNMLFTFMYVRTEIKCVGYMHQIVYGGAFSVSWAGEEVQTCKDYDLSLYT